MTDRTHLKLVAIEDNDSSAEEVVRKAAAEQELADYLAHPDSAKRNTELVTEATSSTKLPFAMESEDKEDPIALVDQVADHQSVTLTEIRLPKTGYALYTDHNGVTTHHLADLPNTDVEGVSYPPGHVYAIEHGNTNTLILFQNGPVKQVGVNGATNENVIVALIDRLRHLNHAFPCEENVQAIGFLSAAMSVLEKRTTDRIARQVEGENKV